MYSYVCTCYSTPNLSMVLAYIVTAFLWPVLHHTTSVLKFDDVQVQGSTWVVLQHAAVTKKSHLVVMGIDLETVASKLPHTATFFLIYLLFPREEGAEEALDQILPDLTHFCSYLSSYVLAEVMVGEDEQDAAIHFMEREFITNQLISMAMVYDLSDEVSRGCLEDSAGCQVER